MTLRLCFLPAQGPSFLTQSQWLAVLLQGLFLIIIKEFGFSKVSSSFWEEKISKIKWGFLSQIPLSNLLFTSRIKLSNILLTTRILFPLSKQHSACNYLHFNEGINNTLFIFFCASRYSCTFSPLLDLNDPHFCRYYKNFLMFAFTFQLKEKTLHSIR